MHILLFKFFILLNIKKCIKIFIEVIKMIKQIEKDMIDYSKGNKKDIAHFMKVHSYAAIHKKY